MVSLADTAVAGAFMAVLTWWLEQGGKLSPQEVDGILRHPVLQGLATGLGSRPDARGRAPSHRSN